jgi:hypothetical protein
MKLLDLRPYVIRELEKVFGKSQCFEGNTRDLIRLLNDTRRRRATAVGQRRAK